MSYCICSGSFVFALVCCIETCGFGHKPFWSYPPNNIPLINKLSPSCGSGITDSYVFTNLLHRSIPGQQFLKDIRICQELHAWQNSEKQFKILEHIKSVCFGSFYDTVDISTRFRPIRCIAEKPVLSAHCKRSDSIFCYVI